MRVLFTAALFTALAGTAFAASDDAWETFRQEVGAACVTAAAGLIENGTAVVDPFGSQSYGLAIVTGKTVGADATASAICVFDKQTKAVEIGGELDLS